mgnify:CR=1 FL=1
MDFEFGFNLLDKKYIGTIELNDKVRISDPCYGIDTWCAGTLTDVLPGVYNCYMQKTDCKDWGVRVASIEIRHKDYSHVEPEELTDIDVGVDSGQAGIYDLDYFVKNREDKNGEDNWYWRVCDNTHVVGENPKYLPFEKTEWWDDEFKEIHKLFKCDAPIDDIDTQVCLRYWKAQAKYRDSIYCWKTESTCTASTLDNKCIVSSSGDGDGSYACLIGTNSEGKIVSIKIDYYYGYDEEDEYEE